MSPHLKAVFQALFITFLWSTSWVFIKIGLTDIPALTFAGLRYVLAFFCLLPFLRRRQLASLAALSPSGWLRLLLLGLLLYSVTQGAQFLGLAYLPAPTVSLLLSFSLIAVALMGWAFLGERLALRQWGGVGLYLLGALLYFYPADFPEAQLFGLGIVVVGVLANAASAVLGRSVNRAGELDPLSVTVVSMGAGAFVLLAAGVSVQGLPALELQGWVIILWLAVVNTAFAFTLWNVTLRTLSAVESSIINNTMLIQIAILAWVFLGETLSLQEIAGLVLAALGTLLVQLKVRARGEVLKR